MKNIHSLLSLIATIMLLSNGTPTISASETDKDPVLNSIQKEIQRNMEGLKLAHVVSPCFIDYRMNTLSLLVVKAVLGSLVYDNIGEANNGTANVVVGDYQNTNQNVLLSYEQIYQHEQPSRMVNGINDEAIRTEIWRVLDKKYKQAAEQYNNKQSLINQIEIPEEEKNIPDFQKMTASTHIYPVHQQQPDRKKISEYIKEASKVFADYKNIDNSYIRIYIGNADVRYCNSEGTICRYSNKLVLMFIYTQAQTKDGETINYEASMPYSSFEDLPSLESLKAICKKQAEFIQEIQNAPMIDEPYVGPVLFEGEAVADLICNLFVNNNNGIIAKRKPILSERFKGYDSERTRGNALDAFINKKVISRDLSLIAMSGTPEYKDKKLFGYYPVDAQGVAPDKACTLIKDGVLIDMLTSRTPTKSFSQSNGHARSSIGGNDAGIYPGVLRLCSKQTEPVSQLKQKLINAAKEEDYAYAYIIRKLNANTPIQIRRVDVTTGTETPIRGAVIQDLLLRSMKRISGVSSEENIYNRVVNDVKTSYVVPSAILLDEVDILKNTRIDFKKPYIVSRPE